MTAIPERIADVEKRIAVTLRREFPDLLPSTDAWRPITQRMCQIVIEALEDEETP